MSVIQTSPEQQNTKDALTINNVMKGVDYMGRTKKQTDDLSKREMDILNILWQAESPLVASDIAKEDETLTINTVQATLRKLLKKELVQVADIVYSGTVLCRSYRPTEASRDLALRGFAAQFHSFKKMVPIPRFVTALLGNETDDAVALKEIEDLEAVIQKEKERILKKQNKKSKEN